MHSSIYTHTYELTVYLHFDFTLIKPWQGLLGYDKTSNPKYLGQCKIQNIVLYCIVFVFRHSSFVFLPSFIKLQNHQILTLPFSFYQTEVKLLIPSLLIY